VARPVHIRSATEMARREIAAADVSSSPNDDGRAASASFDGVLSCQNLTKPTVWVRSTCTPSNRWTSR
jgi:hypothetical protein